MRGVRTHAATTGKLTGGITMMKYLKDVKQGEYFTLKDYEGVFGEVSENRVYVRGEYDRSERKYECYKFADVNSYRYFDGKKIVFTGFTF